MQIQHGWFKSVITCSVFHNMDGNKACPSYQLWSWNSTDSFLFGPTGLSLCPRENTPTANSRKDKKLQPANAIGEEGTIIFTSIFFHFLWELLGCPVFLLHSILRYCSQVLIACAFHSLEVWIIWGWDLVCHWSRLQEGIRKAYTWKRPRITISTYIS